MFRQSVTVERFHLFLSEGVEVENLGDKKVFVIYLVITVYQMQ